MQDGTVHGDTYNKELKLHQPNKKKVHCVHNGEAEYTGKIGDNATRMQQMIKPKA